MLCRLCRPDRRTPRRLFRWGRCRWGNGPPSCVSPWDLPVLSDSRVPMACRARRGPRVSWDPLATREWGQRVLAATPGPVERQGPPVTRVRLVVGRRRGLVWREMVSCWNVPRGPWGACFWPINANSRWTSILVANASIFIFLYNLAKIKNNGRGWRIVPRSETSGPFIPPHFSSSRLRHHHQLHPREVDHSDPCLPPALSGPQLGPT